LKLLIDCCNMHSVLKWDAFFKIFFLPEDSS